MSRNALARVARLENGTADSRPKGLWVVSDEAEAAALRVKHPNALIIITGVRRPGRDPQ
jgi:hypothetical protein